MTIANIRIKFVSVKIVSVRLNKGKFYVIKVSSFIKESILWIISKV
jgi:hypothetical protein